MTNCNEVVEVVSGGKVVVSGLSLIYLLPYYL